MSEGPRIDPGRVTGDIFRGISQIHVPGVDSAFRNEYQVFLGVKTAGAYGWQPYHLNVPIV
jgi:hypothetical protein